MIYVAPSTTETFYLDGAPAGLVGTLQIRIVKPDGTVAVTATTSGITDVATNTDGTHRYKAVVTVPATEGDYLPQWVSGSTVVDDEILRVTTSAPLVTVGGNLTTLDEVRAFMQKGGAGQDDDQDDLITSLIPRASRVIQRYTRIIAPAETAATHRFTWRGRGMLSTSPWFLRSATSVKLAADSTSPTTLDASAYTLEPDPAEDGVYTHLRFVGSGYVESNLELLDLTYANSIQQKVDITGDWGYTAVPEDVKHWANVTVVEWLRKDVSAFSIAFDANEDRLDRPEEIPFAAKRGLRQYRRDEAPKLPALATPRSRPAEAI